MSEDASTPGRDSTPEKRPTVLVAAFGGWTDAEDAASAALEHLALTWSSVTVREIDPDDYYDYQETRPTISVSGGVTRHLRWPTTSISHCRLPHADRDLVFVVGTEPNMRWRAFCREIVEAALDLDVELAVVVGSAFSDTPHTRPVPISGSAHTAEAAARYGLVAADYEGPTGITGVLQDAFVQAGIPAISLWASVPHYLAGPPNPKATLALVRSLEPLIGTPVPIGVLPEQARQWEDGLNEMLFADDEMAAYVRELEQRHDAEPEVGMLTAMDGDALAAEFERYLRQRGGSGDER